jgi:hypothetical protein
MDDEVNGVSAKQRHKDSPYQDDGKISCPYNTATIEKKDLYISCTGLFNDL